LQKARGQFVAFIDADDTWDPNFLSAQLSFQKEMKCPFVYSAYRRLTPRNVDDYPVREKTTYQDILKSNPITCLTVLIDTEAVGLPLMPEDAAFREDIACFYRLLREKTPFALGNPLILATYRLHIGSVSYNKWKMIRYEWRLFRKVEKIGFFKAQYYMFHWVVSGLKYYKNLNRKPLKGGQSS
jgi:teichuronic acid biosynthesis glycosyltransferase TuaG